MRNHNQHQKRQRKRRTSSTVLAALVSLLIVFGIHMARTPAHKEIPSALISTWTEWRKAAAENINTYRKSDLTVLVTDANGKLVPNVEVHVAMKRHAYSFGTAINEDTLLSSPNPDSNKYRDNILQLFNEALNENTLKWLRWENLELRPQAIASVNWLRDKNLKVRGHSLIWPSWHHMPFSLEKLYYDILAQQGKTAADEVLRDRIVAHIREVVGNFKLQIAEWDVVNEPVQNPEIQNILGQSVVVDWFNAAHQADPDAVLYLNENLYEDDTFAESYEREIQYLVDNDAPLGGIGIEGHIFKPDISIPQFLNTLDRFAKFNLPIKITEFDVLTPDKELQANITRDVMTAVFSHPATNGFLMWGFWDGNHWLSDAPIYDKDWRLKPSGKVYMDLVFNEWWTDVFGKTSANGEYKVRGFLGDYEVTVSKDRISKTVSTTLSRNGTSLIIADIN